jgi:ATP-binding cassette subfamily B protein
MSTATDDDDDPFEEQREEVDNAMVQLFEAYGQDHDFEAVVAILASVFARVLDLAPPVLLGLAIDSVIQKNKPFLPWLPR